MSNNLISASRDIKKEADQFLSKTLLLEELSKFGLPHISGSYFLDLMTWRDLDIYLEVNSLEVTKCFELGKELANLLKPVKMQFRNETGAGTAGLPHGLYWGIYLGDERKGAWKIDLWLVHPPELERLLNYCRQIQSRLDEQSVLAILAIKSECWQDPAYRKAYTSSDIYEAVLERQIRTVTEFRTYRGQKIK
jgi:hypothetical protein